VTNTRSKIITPYEHIDLITRACLDMICLTYKGFSCYIGGLVGQGWNIELTYNKYTHRQKLYIRHPELRLIGRIELSNEQIVDLDYETVELDYLMQEHNLRKSSIKIREDSDSISLDSDRAAILEFIYEDMKREVKPKPKPSAEIIDIHDVINRYKESA